MKFKAQLTDIYLANCDDMSIPEMAEHVFNGDGDISLSLGTITNYLYRIRRDQSQVLAVIDEPAWRIQDGKYLFEDHHGQTKVFSISLIDQIFLQYSDRGYNWTRAEVQQRNNITPKTFSRIQNVFHLSKKSDIFSPHTKSITTKEELEDLTETLMKEIMNSGEITERKRRQALERRYKKAIDYDNKEMLWRNTVIDEVLAEYASSEMVTLSRIQAANPYREISVQVTDIHAGSESYKMKITEDWNIDKMEEKLDRIATIVNGYGARKVHLNFLGDLVETISGINHPDSWKLIQDGKWGGEAIIFAKEVVARFISKVNNVVSINGVGGNHDRLQASNKLSDDGATRLIFYMLEKELANTDVEVRYDATMLPLDMEKYGDILCHGDKALHKKSIDFLIMAQAIDKNKYQFIESGHFHTFKTLESSMMGRKTSNPSIITGNHYSDIDIGKSDKSGFSIHFMNEFDEPTQHIINI